MDYYNAFVVQYVVMVHLNEAVPSVLTVAVLGSVAYHATGRRGDKG